jgi:hypothetical protein
MGVDAFKQSWKGENNWLVPPPRLVCKVLDKMKLEEATGTLVVPKWVSAPYWPLLLEFQNKSTSLIVSHKLIGSVNVTKSGKGNNGVFAKSVLPFDMLAVRLRF